MTQPTADRQTVLLAAQRGWHGGAVGVVPSVSGPVTPASAATEQETQLWT